MIREQKIKLIEELSLNAWPSHKIELYDGWLIRFSHNYTYRTNSVEQVGASTIPVTDKIEYCEAVYRNFRTPASFKINPLLDPAFDTLLEQRGYTVRHTTEVMTLALDGPEFRPYPSISEEYEFYGRNSGLPSWIDYPGDTTVSLRDTITDEWIQGLFRLNGTVNPVLRRIVPSMFKAIPKETIVAAIELDGRMVASGLGIIDRGYIGLYAIYVDHGCRRREYARSICSAILTEGKKHGCQRSYLQVVKGNSAAKALYESLGYRDFYTYWFRWKEEP
ncbi:MAG: GNAT family N-acetyltransferase [Candidatus Choladocola sp.]|nr:GNAT family N-acetyltransferase [Candidatus Choladocola sp.]